MNNKLIVVAGGCEGQGVMTTAEVSQYLDAGADSCQVVAKIFLEGPYALQQLEDAVLKNLD